MKKKIICIGIVSLFVMAGLTSLSAAEIKSNVIQKSSDTKIILGLDSKKVIRETRKDRNCNLENSQDFDLYVDCIAWWIPSPDNQLKGNFCYNSIINYTGEYDNSQDYIINISKYLIGTNGTIIMTWVTGPTTFGTNHTPKVTESCSYSMTPDEIPRSFEIGFETNYPDEKDKDNNQKTVDVGDGITVYGDVTMNGKPIDGSVWVLADTSHFLDSYIKGYVHWDHAADESSYEVFAPYIPGYIYPIKVRKNTGEHKIKNLSLNGTQRAYQLDFYSPNPPSIDGPTYGKPSETYTYDFTLSDPNDDNLLELEIDFGDEIIHPVPPEHGWLSGSKVTVDHSWEEKGIYTIEARVMDRYSDWSKWGTLKVSMPKNKAINRPFIRFLENILGQHPCMFPMLRQLIGL